MTEQEPQINQIATIARREWKRTKPRELSRKEEIDNAVELIDRVSSIVKTSEKRARKANKQFTKRGKVEMQFKSNLAGFYYEFYGRTETLSFGIEDESVEIELKHGKKGGLSDAIIKYLPDLFDEDNSYTGLTATQRANGLADRLDLLLNSKSG